jgi:hypothetical protein
MSSQPSSYHWQRSPVPLTAEWAERCFVQLIALDPLLDHDEARTLAADMAERQHWRNMLPEQAAEALFQPIAKTHDL